ncbi:response regulator [soil metagenome]
MPQSAERMSDDDRAAGEAPRPSVLLVDDRPANLLALEAILSDLPVKLVRASSGSEALRALLKQDFALVLLDVQMPNMDGFETAAAMKAHPRTADVPLIFVTAISREASHVFEGYERGAVDYVLKPFDPAILRAKVSIFVDLHRKSETIKVQAKLLREREVAALEKRSELRYRRLAEAMPLIRWAAHPDGRVYYTNRGSTDYSDAMVEHVGSPPTIHGDDAAAALAAWTEAQRAVVPFELEARLLRQRDESYRWQLIRATPQRGEHGELEGWVVTATDIHAQKLAEEVQERLYAREQAAREAAEAANRAKDEFLATVSHELRTPLNSILGWAQMLSADMLDERQRARALETIERNALLQAELIEDIVDIARVKSGKLRLRAEVIELGRAATIAVDSIRPTAQKKNIDVTLDATAELTVVGDPDRLQQIVSNLVSNAIKFTPEGGKVNVAVIPDGSEHALVRVVDSGVGIAPQFLPHVFDRFLQADGSSTRRHQGLGLGLSIVKTLVDLHRGTITAESEGVGKGATFGVRLPLSGVAPAAPSIPLLDAPLAGDLAAHDLDGLSVLFVDNHEPSREMFAALAEAHGASVVCVDSVDAALEVLEKGKTHVLVSDIGLGDRDGYDLIREVRRRTLEVPAIAVTAFSKADDGGRALAAGFQFLLSKPVDAAELLALVATLGDARRHSFVPGK